MSVILKTSLDYAVNWTKVCNYALNALGVESLADLSEGTPNSELCNRHLPNAIRKMLTEYDWNFAKKRVKLAALAEKPLFGWKKQFHLPVDMIRIIRVYGTNSDAAADDNRAPYEIEENKLLTDSEEIEIIYISRPLTADEMPFHFTDALAAYMAYLLAPALTSNEQLIALMLQESKNRIETAKRIDAGQNYAPEFDGERWYGEARN